MIDDRLRRLMGRVARGLPVLALGAAPFVLPACGRCPPSPITNVIVIPSAGGDAGRADAGDAGAGDAGDAGDAGTGDARVEDASTRPTCWTLCEETPDRPGGELRGCTEVAGGIECTYDEFISCGVGRHPMCSITAAATEHPVEPTRKWLLEVATAELASVPAFEELAEALIHHGAPEALVQRARVSAEDEVCHARLAFALARRLGEPGRIRVEISAAPVTNLRELALHNVKEGCVREAFGSLEAAWQAQHAVDRSTREVFARIARDEAAHAMLSLDIDRWARGLLDADAHVALDEARAEAMREIRAKLAERATPPGLGVPPATEASRLLDMVA